MEQNNETNLQTQDNMVETAEIKKKISFFQEVIQNLQLIWRLIKDPNVPIALKLIPAGTLVYLIMPIDVLPDAFLGLGQLDDLGVLLVGLKAFVEMAPKDIVAQHRKELRGELLESDKELSHSIIIDQK
ncbi:MAG: DUF1232 domain-containing protein [Ardenticatenaceae bacterium]|nr:DUF1232 domain-containing protein [Ardenticatenaceae bacterium]